MNSLRARLWLGFGGLLLILVAVSTLTVVVLTRYSHALQQVFRENYDSAVFCDRMKDALDGMDAAAQRQAWGGADAADDIAAARAQFDENLARQLGNCTLPGELELTRGLQAQWSAYQAGFDHLAVAPPAQRGDVYRRELLPRFQQVKSTARQVADMNMATMVSVDGQARRTLGGVRNALLVLVSAGTLLAAVVVGAAVATIVRPLRRIGRAAAEIGRGNLDLAIPVQSADELGQLAIAFNAMAGQLREFRRLDREKLSRTQQTTQTAIDSLPDAVCLIGPDGTIEIANRAAGDYFGIAPGKRLDELNLDWLTRVFVAVRDEHRPLDPEGYRSAIQIFDHGRERFLLPRAVPVIGADGATIGVTVVLADVTRLRHADELKSGLLSTVSHELRTPLTSIRMALGLLTGDKLGRMSAPQQKLLAAARQDGERLYRIIENLLNISRIEAGRSTVHPQRVAAAEVVALAVEPLRAGFAEKGLALRVDVPPGQPDVLADPVSIGFALTNLLTNGLKFTPAPGEVSVSVAAEPATVTADAAAVRFTVDDTGPGVPPEYAARVFDKFFRLPREPAQSGAGLGLTIAKEIVEAHHGTIAFAPRPGGGSRFSFTLPAFDADADPDASPERRRGDPLHLARSRN